MTRLRALDRAILGMGQVEMDRAMQAMRCRIPEGECDGLRVVKFTVPENDLYSLRYAMQGRPVPPGYYTKLIDAEHLWMSDTPVELQDHMPVVMAISASRAKRVLVNGLGLGLVIQAALTFETVQQIDVVENDYRVIKLVGKEIGKDKRVAIHHADAYEQARAWPPNSYWDVVWHDIWQAIDADNLEGMQRLHRSYGGRCGWQGSWARRECEQIRDINDHLELWGRRNG